MCTERLMATAPGVSSESSSGYVQVRRTVPLAGKVTRVSKYPCWSVMAAVFTVVNGAAGVSTQLDLDELRRGG